VTVVFFGTSDYCLPVLEALKNSFDLKLVVTRADKPTGRKQILTPSATKQWAQANNVPVSEFLDLDCDLGIVADFGRIIPEEEFIRPKLGTFNIHFSKLPDLRGASPVQAAILRGDTKTAITIFRIEKTLDTGPILWQQEFPIESTETAQDLYKKLFGEAAKKIPELDFSSPLIPQVGSPTFCKKLTKEDGRVELNDPNIYNKYRAYYPWPGIWTIKDGRRMKILKCHPDNEKLVLDEIQFEGEKPKQWPL
jgi:methionyl-tRNA formyltransferase